MLPQSLDNNSSSSVLRLFLVLEEKQQSQEQKQNIKIPKFIFHIEPNKLISFLA